MIGIKQADRKNTCGHPISGRMRQSKPPGEISWQHWDVALQLGIQLDLAVVGSVVVVVVVVVVVGWVVLVLGVVVVGVGHSAGNKQNKTAHQAVQPTKI